MHGSNIFIVMPHCTGGDLYSLLARQRKKKRLPEEVVVDCLRRSYSGWSICTATTPYTGT